MGSKVKEYRELEKYIAVKKGEIALSVKLGESSSQLRKELRVLEKELPTIIIGGGYDCGHEWNERNICVNCGKRKEY